MSTYNKDIIKMLIDIFDLNQKSKKKIMIFASPALYRHDISPFFTGIPFFFELAKVILVEIPEPV